MMGRKKFGEILVREAEKLKLKNSALGARYALPLQARVCSAVVLTTRQTWKTLVMQPLVMQPLCTCVKLLLLPQSACFCSCRRAHPTHVAGIRSNCTASDFISATSSAEATSK